MHNIERMVKGVVREAMYDRPFGIAYTGAMVENEADIKKLHEHTAWESDAHGISLDDWKMPEDYHMTICLGELPLHMKMRGDLNGEVEMHATHFGYTDKAMAFRVTGYMSKNDTQHITVAFREVPADSKEISEWHELKKPFSVQCIIREVPKLKP